MTSAIDQERDKWEKYYAALPHEQDELPEALALYREMAAAVGQVLPRGGAVLEAGCGSGRHSLELARTGGVAVSLLDFSEHAIAYARQVFAKEGLPASFEVGDVFQAESPRQHDLVFNSGVLEHYEFARQVAFLEGMKQRSRRFVLVLVPNRDCYWYWIWRIQEQAAGRWPYGYEKPAVDYRAAIEAAGLHYLGKAYFGAAAVERIVASTQGMAPELRELVRQVHGQMIAPAEQRSYMVGFLAAVAPEPAVPAPFAPPGDGQGYLTRDLEDRYIALVGDALATRITAQQDVAAGEARCKHLEEQLAAARREAESARQETAGLRASTSWRLTAPLRALARLLRGGA